MLKLLKELTAADGVSGFEAPIRHLIAEKCRPYADEMHVDTMGNLVVFKKGKKHNAPKLMIAAHMDEVGFLITKIEDTGVLRFQEAGGMCGLGSDQAPGNNCHNIIHEMKNVCLFNKIKYQNPEVMPAWRALRMATIEGAHFW